MCLCYCAAFTSYGAFWLSFATILIPGSGVGAAYATDAAAGGHQEDDAIGIFLATWMIVTFLFLCVPLPPYLFSDLPRAAIFVSPFVIFLFCSCDLCFALLAICRLFGPCHLAFCSSRLSGTRGRLLSVSHSSPRGIGYVFYPPARALGERVSGR